VLVLVDGLRWVPGGPASGVPGSVDLNTIPHAMISRIGGAAGRRLADLRLRRHRRRGQHHHQGPSGRLRGQRQIGTSDHSDGFMQDYNVSWGAQTGGTHIVVGGGYFKQDPILAADRAISRFPAPFATSCLAGGLQLGHAQRAGHHPRPEHQPRPGPHA
jgi:iron complex outermembrane receptor protein